MFRIKCVDCEQMFSSDDKDHVVCDSCWEKDHKDEEAIIEEDGCECGERNCMCPYFDVVPRIGRD